MRLSLFFESRMHRRDGEVLEEVLVFEERHVSNFILCG